MHDSSLPLWSNDSSQSLRDAAELLSQLLERACLGLQRLRAFNENPDVADDTFLLATRVLSYSPKLLLANGRLVGALLDTATVGLLVNHKCGHLLLPCL